jgi:hypothetical protein
MKNNLIILIGFVLLAGCSKEDLEKKYIGNKYAHVFFETREECEASWEIYFMNCAQILEVVNDSEVEIMLTDIMYTTKFHIKNGNLIVKSTPETYEFSEDLIFKIQENGNLKLGESEWVKFEDSIYEVYEDD